MPRDPMVSFRLPKEDATALKALAKRLKTSQSGLARDAVLALLADAEGRELADVADRDELLRLLTSRSRAGSVPAMGRLLDELRRAAGADDDEDTGDDFDNLERDELAPRREAKAG